MELIIGFVAAFALGYFSPAIYSVVAGALGKLFSRVG